MAAFASDGRYVGTEDTKEFVAIVRGIDLVPRDEFMLHNSRILTKRFSLENRGLLRDGAQLFRRCLARSGMSRYNLLFIARGSA